MSHGSLIDELIFAFVMCKLN